MNKNLKLFLGLSLMSVLSVVLFSAKDNVASAADAGYGYGYSIAPAGGTYTSSPVNTVFSGGQVVSITDLLNNTTPTPTNTKTPIIVDLSNGSTTTYGYGSTTTSTLDNSDAKFVLPNTGVAN